MLSPRAGPLVNEPSADYKLLFFKMPHNKANHKHTQIFQDAGSILR